MKITIVHNDNKKQLLVSTKTMEKLLERIAKDDSKQSVTRFRDYAACIEEDYRFYKDMPTWMHHMLPYGPTDGHQLNKPRASTEQAVSID